MTLASNSVSVAEFHGPYGPYHVSELVLQRIWLERAFDESCLRDQSGRAVEIVDPGSWNRLEGPDFTGAVLIIDGQRVIGDVEVHFAQSNWSEHGHQFDTRYNSVVLHVVYHPPAPGSRAARRQDGVALPCVALLPALWYALEEYASEDSIVASTGMDLSPEVEQLAQMRPADRKEFLRDKARWRWTMKRHYAKLRVGRLGWEAACHQTALEILGYSRNRLPMLRVAERFPLEAIAGEGGAVESLWQAGSDRWRLGGTRPANHPKRRLQQYIEWIGLRPRWPELLEREGALIAASRARDPDPNEIGFSTVRRLLRVAQARAWFDKELTASSIGGLKLDTLVCDGFLPLLSLQDEVDLFEKWFHWFPADAPASCALALRQIELLRSRQTPLCNGWIQGLLGARMRSQ